MPAMKRILWLLVVLILAACVDRRSGGAGEMPRPGQMSDPASREERGGINRNARSLRYSRHARCRMACRQISESEILDILRNGRINYAKSDLRGKPDPKYAVEGLTGDGQEVRIVFANSPHGLVVVTVIDLEKEWKCHCK